MKLKAVVDSLDEVDARYHDLYTERNGKWEITEIEGIKTSADVERIQEGLRKEKEDHKKTKQKLSKFSQLEDADIDDIVSKLDRIEELEAEVDAAKSGNDDKVNALVEARVKSKVAPLERELSTLRKQNEELTGEVDNYKTGDRKRRIHDAIRKAATESSMRPEAIDDAIMYGENVMDIDDDGNIITRDNVGITPGIDAKVMLSEMQERRPHWWPDSVGGGARGGAGGGGVGSNPWKHDSWNMTEQGKILKENRTRAEQLAKAAGTTIGGPRPEPSK